MREEWKIVRENAYTGSAAELEENSKNGTDLQVRTFVQT